MYIDSDWINFNTYDIIQNYKEYTSSLRLFDDNNEIVCLKTFNELIFDIKDLTVAIKETYDIYQVFDDCGDAWFIIATCIQDVRDVINKDMRSETYSNCIKSIELIGHALDNVDHSSILFHDSWR